MRARRITHYYIAITTLWRRIPGFKISVMILSKQISWISSVLSEGFNKLKKKFWLSEYILVPEKGNKKKTFIRFMKFKVVFTPTDRSISLTNELQIQPSIKPQTMSKYFLARKSQELNSVYHGHTIVSPFAVKVRGFNETTQMFSYVKLNYKNDMDSS